MSISNEAHYRRLRGRLSINPMALDEELIDMPQLVQEAAEYTAEALQVRDNCKNRLDFITAQVGARLREVPVSEDGGKPKARTEGAVAEQRLLDDGVQEAIAELEMCKYDLALWQGLHDGLKEKSSSLKRIAELTVAGYLTPGQVYQNRREELAQQRGGSTRKVPGNV